MTITVDIRPEVQAELAQQAAARGRAHPRVAQRGHARRPHDQGIDRRRPSVSRFVLDNTVTMARCFTDKATKFKETLLSRLSNQTDSAIVPALWLYDPRSHRHKSARGYPESGRMIGGTYIRADTSLTYSRRYGQRTTCASESAKRRTSFASGGCFV